VALHRLTILGYLGNAKSRRYPGPEGPGLRGERQGSKNCCCLFASLLESFACVQEA
jgi:hypothetical protein